MRQSITAAGLAVVALWALPMTAAAAGPGQHKACSGSVCVDITGGFGPSPGHVLFRYDFELPGETIAAGAVLTGHQGPGLTPDPSSVRVFPSALSAPTDVTVAGNDISFSVAETVFGEFEVQFETSVDPAATGYLSSYATLTFAGAGGGPTVTSTSPDVVLTAGPDVALNQMRVEVNPDIGSADLGYETDRVPHGYTATADAFLLSHGAADVPAGATFLVTMSPGFSLGEAGVRLGVRDGSPGTRLTCTGSAPTWTCTLPTLPAGTSRSVLAAVHAADDAPIGQEGSVRFHIPPTAIGDINTGDNTVSHRVVVGPVSRLDFALRVDPDPVPVGISATASITVTNNGPDTAVDYPFTFHISADVSVDDAGGGRVIVAEPLASEIEFREGRPVQPGESATFRVRFTPQGTDTAALLDLRPAFTPSQLFSPCSTGACLGADFTVDFVAPNSRTPQRGLADGATPGTSLGNSAGKSGPMLANTGSETGATVLLAVLLLLCGTALLAAGTGLGCRPTSRRSRRCPCP